jgi:tripartite-type tricarboxylate transporter receptor subunit TctC
VGRILAEAAGQILGQPMIVENRAGAGSVIGSEAAARAPADGYTLLINSSLATLPAMVSRMPYNTLTDFEGVAVAGFSPHLLVVNPRVEARTAQEFVALLRANPGRFNYASAGIGSGPHIAGLLFMSLMNVQVETVHYRGGGPGVAAMVSGEAHFGTPTMASSVGQVRGGNLRALAVLSDQRSPALPDVPSAPEAGLPGVVFEEFFPIVTAMKRGDSYYGLPTAVRSLALFDNKKLLAEARIAVSPGIGFGDYGDDYVRIALIENEQRCRQAVRGIREMFRKDGLLPKAAA